MYGDCLKNCIFGVFSLFHYLVNMPRPKKKKTNNLSKYREEKKAAAFKAPVPPPARTGSSTTSSISSRQSSALSTDTLGRTRSQARRGSHVGGTVVLPEYHPIDVDAWTQDSVDACQEGSTREASGNRAIYQLFYGF